MKLASTSADMLEAARRYTSAGMIIHPIGKPVKGDKKTGKAPIEKKWSSRTEPRSEADLTRFWGKETDNPYNIGLLCGERSGITVLDIDDHNPAIINDLLNGIDTTTLVMSSRTPERGHYYFRYTPELRSVKKHFIGFEVLNNGSNAVLPPSNHYSGTAYKMNKVVTSLNDFPEMPATLINRIKELIKTSDKLEAALDKCRPCLKRRFEEHQEKKNVKDWHGATGRDITLALMIELYANGAGKDGLTLVCKMLFRGEYNATTTEKEINYIIDYADKGGKPWTCETIKNKCGYITINPSEPDKRLCDTCKMEDIVKEAKEKQKSAEAQKIIVHFDEVAERVMKENHIFTMRDNGQLYLYRDGVYRSEGAEAILNTLIRDVYRQMYEEKWKSKYDNLGLPEHIPKATVRFVNEVLAYIKAYTHIPREPIDTYQDKYINFKNCLFNLDKWEFEAHSPEIKTICQIPVYYDPKAECPKIKKFLREVTSSEEDIAFLEEWAGYCLTTDVSYQKALMLYGIPGTGKSVFATLLETFIGSENTSSESLQKIEEDKYRAAKLYGKRVNICSDIPSTKLHKTEVFKKLVSGLDTIDAENKYEHPFKFKNKAKLTFSANKIPEGPKDPAFYERFCLIEFGHKFRGTANDDKKLIQKLTTDDELSGFLNLALKGLKRLYENDRFSYNKTFEETEREYILNSNPVAFFMEECTVVSDQDTESTILYLAYVAWSKENNITHVSNIEFSRRLKKLGYTNHRENVNGNGYKKVTLWDNVKLKPSEENNKDDEKEKQNRPSGTGSGQDQNNRSCPKKSRQPITENLTKNDFGQDQNSCVSFATKNYQNDCENIETVKAAKNGENENSPNELKRSCPSVRFFDSGKYGQDVPNHPVQDPVQKQKTLIFEQNEETDNIKNLSSCELMRMDLKNFARSRYNFIVNNIPVFVGEFNKEFPGYKQKYGQQAVLSNAERLSSRGWK